MYLSVDPGLLEWAYAVFDEDGVLHHSETISYKKPKQTQEKRLNGIRNTLEVQAQNYNITKIICERQFVDIMQQITGVVRSVAGSVDVESILFTPASWRKLATGKGNATEELVKETVIKVYPELINASEHEIDSAAIYLAYRKHVGL